MFIPNFVVAVNFMALLAPTDACNQSATGIVASTFAALMSCRPEPGSDGCG